jgi:hypothetical protein
VGGGDSFGWAVDPRRDKSASRVSYLEDKYADAICDIPARQMRFVFEVIRRLDMKSLGQVIAYGAYLQEAADPGWKVKRVIICQELDEFVRRACELVGVNVFQISGENVQRVTSG